MLAVASVAGRLVAIKMISAGDLATAADIARFRVTYAPVVARRLVVSPAPSWLPGGTGIALATSAPESVFRITTGQRMTVRTAEGVFSVKALDDTGALGAYGSGVARPAIMHALESERRADAYAAWTVPMQKASEGRLVCGRDRPPGLGLAGPRGWSSLRAGRTVVEGGPGDRGGRGLGGSLDAYCRGSPRCRARWGGLPGRGADVPLGNRSPGRGGNPAAHEPPRLRHARRPPGPHHRVSPPP